MTHRARRTRSLLAALAIAGALVLAACASAVDGDPTLPAPTDPAPTDPAPTDPAPTDPSPPPATETGTWQSLPASSSNRQEVAYVAAGGRLYLAGGSALHEAYDPATETWTAVAPLPGWRDHVQGVAVDGRVYYVGGLTSWPAPHTTDVLIYDPDDDAFSSGTPMPRGRGGGGVAEEGGVIYYAGGMHDGQAVPWFDAYDTATDTWSEGPDMPIVRDHFHGAIVDGVFYAIGGRDTDIDATTPQVDAFDIASGTWSTLDTELPTLRGGFASAVIGSEILIIGGEGGGETFDTVEAYDTQANSWRELEPMPTARHGIQAAVLGSCVFVAAGGETQGGANPSAVHEVFTLDASTPCGADAFTSIAWSTMSDALPPGRMEAQGIAHGGTLYVFGGYTSWSPDPLCTTDTSMVYDPATDAWSALAPMPVLWTHAGTVADGDDLFLAGGRANDEDCSVEVSSDTVWRYHIPTDSWHDDVPRLPGDRSSGGFVRLGRDMHFFSGVSSGHPGGFMEYWREEGDHWVLSLDGGTAWQPRAPLPDPRSHLAAVALDGRIYAIGGQLGEGGYADTLANVHRYDPLADAWTTLPPLPANLSHKTVSTLAIGERIVVLGGERAHGDPVAEVLAFDPADETWTLLNPLPTARRSGVAGFIDGKIYYATGGGSFSTTTYQGTLR